MPSPSHEHSVEFSAPNVIQVVIGRVKPSEVEPVYAQLKKKKRLSKPTIVAPIFSHLTPLHIANNSDSPGMRRGVRPLVGRIMKPQSAQGRYNQKPTLIDLKPLNVCFIIYIILCIYTYEIQTIRKFKYCAITNRFIIKCH